jgi:copper chaperone CopZ
MFKNKYSKFTCLLLASIIFVIAISVSLVHAESPLDGYNDYKPSYIVSISAQQELDEVNTGTEDIEEYEFYIKGMTCADCEVKVKEALLKCSGVKDVSSSHEDGYTVIEADNGKMDANEIIGAVAKAGYTVIEED